MIEKDMPVVAGILLTAEEVAEVSGGFTRATAQLAELHRQGFWRARLSRVTGAVVLERAHYLAVCTGAPSAPAPATEPSQSQLIEAVAPPPPKEPPAAKAAASAPLFFREKQVLSKFAPVHRATWWRWIKSGRAPPPVSIGPGTVVWRLADLERWQRGEWKPAHPASR